MGFLGFLGIAVPIGGFAIFIVFLVAMIQEKHANKGETVRMAFSYVVSVIMLVIVVSSTVFLAQRALKSWVFTKADTQVAYYSQPPLLFLGSDKGTPAAGSYACTSTCDFTALDKDQLVSWKASYQAWQADSKRNSADSYTATSHKQDIASAVSFFIVSLPLFIWFFMFMIQKEWKKHKSEGAKPGPIRTTYFYLVALAGLIGLVVSTALLINVGIKSALGVASTSPLTSPVTAPTSINGSETASVQSIIDCTSACGFTTDDKEAAQNWLKDYATWKNQTSQSSPVQNDFANFIPILLATAPLFFYHFLMIRRESKEDHDHPAPPPVAAST